MKETNKEDKIGDALERLQKKYGEGVVIQPDEESEFKVEFYPTGSYGIDTMMGAGLPKGRIIEIYGEPSAGKSVLTTFLMAQIQKGGGRVALIDAEHAFDSAYAKNIGLDTSKLFISQPTDLEEAMDVVRELVKTGEFDIITIDSVAALTPRAELEGEEMLKEGGMALQARLLGKSLRILTSEISKSKTTVIFINQVRDKVGVFYGAKTSTPGGKALKFFSSVRLDVVRGEKFLDKNEEQIGNELKITAVKNKVGKPFKRTSIDLYYTQGIDLFADTLDFGEKCGVIEKSGNTYTFKDNKLGVGRDNAKKYLSNNIEVYNAVRTAIDNTLKHDDKRETKNA